MIKLTKKMQFLSAATIMLAGACGIAQAGMLSSGVTTATADAVFAPDATIVANLNVVPVLYAGDNADQTTIAAGTITVTSTATGATPAIRWAPTAGTMDSSDNSVMTINAQSGADPINFKIAFANMTQTVSGTDKTWYYDSSKPASINYKVVLSGAQTVPSDTYPLALDAVAWIE